MKRYIKSSTSVRYKMFNYFGIPEYDLVDDLFTQYYLKGKEFPSYESFMQFYNNNFLCEEDEYNATVYYLSDIIHKNIDSGKIKFYTDNGTEYIKLSDVYWIWILYEHQFTLDEIEEELQSYITAFKRSYDKQLYVLGGEDLCICIDYDYDSVLNYDYLKSQWDSYEQEIMYTIEDWKEDWK